MNDPWKNFLDRLDNSELGRQSPITNICKQFEEVFCEHMPQDVSKSDGENHD